MTTIAAAVAAAAARLTAAGLPAEDAARDAGVLARGLLGWSLADWLARRDHPAAAGFTETLDGFITRRAAREPVAYLLERREFYGRPFRVGPDVLIPRPETELLVEAVLDTVGDRSATIVDVGTGSGCIAITLALEAARGRVTATDISEAAIAIARANADALGAPAITWRHADLLEGDAGPIDIIVSNPPYVPSRDAAGLSRDVRDHEPALALFAGPDGLDVVRRLIPQAARVLAADGTLFLEVGAGQWPAVTDLLGGAGFGEVVWHADLQGIARVVEARR